MRTRFRTAVAGQVAVGAALGCVAALAPAATLDKAFLAASIASGASTTLRFTVTNPAGAPALTNVGFVDQLPSGLVVASPASVGGTCSNAAAATLASPGTATITVTGLNVPPGASTCTVTVDVTNAAGKFNPSCAGNPAAFTNASGNVTLTNVTDAIQASCLVVTPPTLAKDFVPASIASGGASALTFTIANPAGAPALTNVGFVDQLPSGLVVASPANVGGTCSNAAAATLATPGTSTITVAALNAPPGASTCTVTVDVTNVAGQVNNHCGGNPAAFTNASGNVTLTNVADAVQPRCLVVSGSSAPGAPPTPVPALRDWALMLLAIAVAGMALRVMRRGAAPRSGRMR